MGVRRRVNRENYFVNTDTITFEVMLKVPKWQLKRQVSSKRYRIDIKRKTFLLTVKMAMWLEAITTCTSQKHSLKCKSGNEATRDQNVLTVRVLRFHTTKPSSRLLALATNESWVVGTAGTMIRFPSRRSAVKQTVLKCQFTTKIPCNFPVWKDYRTRVLRFVFG